MEVTKSGRQVLYWAVGGEGGVGSGDLKARKYNISFGKWTVNRIHFTHFSILNLASRSQVWI